MTLDALRPPPPLPDWATLPPPFLPGPAEGTAFDSAIRDADGTDLSFDVDAGATRIGDETDRRNRTGYTATTEVAVSGADGRATAVPLRYQASLPEAAATPAAMRALNPFDPATLPNGATVTLDGADMAGTEFEAAFRSLAQANDLAALEDLRVIVTKTGDGDLRVMSGAAALFADPEAHGPASSPLVREDFTLHTTLLDPADKADLAEFRRMFVAGELPAGTVRNAEDVSAAGINGLVTDTESGETNDVAWTYDAQGRPIAAEATLTWEPGSGGRDTDRIENAAQSDFRKDNQLAGTGDHVGHMLAYRFVNGHGPANMFPQDGNLNTGPYARMEGEWADWLGEGMEVRIGIALGPVGAARPDRVQVDYAVIDPASGKVVYDPSEIVFDNQAGETFDRIALSNMDDLIERANA